MLSGERASPHTAAKLTFLSRISETLFKIEIWIRGVSDTETLRLWDAKILKHWDSELFRLWNAKSISRSVNEMLRLWDIKILNMLRLWDDGTMRLSFWTKSESLPQCDVRAAGRDAGIIQQRKILRSWECSIELDAFLFFLRQIIMQLGNTAKLQRRNEATNFPWWQLRVDTSSYSPKVSYLMSILGGQQQQRNLSLSSNSPTATDALQSKNPSSSSYLSL